MTRGHAEVPIPPRPLRVYYGGTFDPVHDGHLAVARLARDTLSVPVILLPAADRLPHRASPEASAADRLAMLERAVADEPGLSVDARETRRGVASYTVDTLRELRGELGLDAPIAFVVGADSFAGLPGWKEWRALFDLAHFVVADRPGARIDDGLPEVVARASAGRWCDRAEALSNRPHGLILRLPPLRHAATASDVRARIAGDRAWQALLPAAVGAYIVEHRLYGRAPGTAASL